MICRNCGTEIADKAIVCYRCGTGTAEPARKPVEIRPRRRGLIPIVVAILVALAALFFGWEYHVFGLELVLPPPSALALDHPSAVNSAAILIDFPAIHA
jgi:hypothetical protein